MTTVLAIDQGTSGTKALVIDEDGEVRGLAEVPVHPNYLPDGGVEQDPHALLESVLLAGRRAIASAECTVDIVTLANQGESVLAWDPTTGEPLTPILVWQDRRAAALCVELADSSRFVTARTGLILDSYFSAPKMAWLRRHLTRDGVVTTTDSWLVHRLTGEFVTDVTTASRSMLMNLDTQDWDPELLEVFGLDHEKLPRIVDCDESVGMTTAFGGLMEFGGLVVDQQAALIAQDCLRPGEMKCTFGTGAFLLANTGDSGLRSNSGLAASVAWKVDGRATFCVDGQVYAAASAVRWLEQLGLIASAAELDAVAADDAKGVLSVPAFAGLAAPWWRSEAKASLIGMSLSTGRGEIVLAVLQGIAAQVAELAELVAGDLGRPLTRLRVDGGLTRSRTLIQAVADQLQVPIDVYPSPHATALGSAALGRLASGGFADLPSAILPWTPADSFTPAWDANRAEDFHAAWNRAVDTAGERTPS